MKAEQQQVFEVFDADWSRDQAPTLRLPGRRRLLSERDLF